jgi:hypothetical protein
MLDVCTFISRFLSLSALVLLHDFLLSYTISAFGLAVYSKLFIQLFLLHDQ